MPFIVFEGLDGSGKSSLITAIEEELHSRALVSLRTREPGGTELGDEIRNLILRRQGMAPTARTELLLYEASRAQHVELVIVPALKSNAWVLCDRFSASSVAFQAGGREISEDWVVKLNEFATHGLAADLTILLDLSVENSRSRRQNRQTTSGTTEDRIESETDQFHERVRQSFLQQAVLQPDKWLVLNAAQTPDELRDRTISHLKILGWLR